MHYFVLQIDMCLLMALILNTLHAAGVRRRHISKCHKIVKNLTNFKFRYYVWFHHTICIQISTNMPSIGSVIPEIAFDIWNIMKTKTLVHGLTIARVLCVNMFIGPFQIRISLYHCHCLIGGSRGGARVFW